jgi:undecaprenyl-phosphate 4-deoxy-4-formamido-L-arabinose transferase
VNVIATPEPTISIVIPIFNEASNLPLLCERLFPVLDGLKEPFEVIAVDDGSSDDSLAILRREQEKRPELRLLSLARNFGQHAAVLAGFDEARGEWIVTIDADLQNPPEEIPKVVEAFRQGYDIVNTVRQGRHDTLFRRLASRFNSWLTRCLSGVSLKDFGCMLRGYHKSVVEPIARRQELRAYIPALGMLYARNPVEIPVAHSERAAGRSKYSLRKLLRLQLDLMTTFSISPLRLLFTLGGMIALFSMLFGAFLLIMRLVYGSIWAAQGVFTLFALVFFFIGAQFIAFGLLGEYIGRIYLEVRQRPAYLLREEYSAFGRRGSGKAERDIRRRKTAERTPIERA